MRPAQSRHLCILRIVAEHAWEEYNRTGKHQGRGPLLAGFGVQFAHGKKAEF
jgi:hypothetical protein